MGEKWLEQGVHGGLECRWGITESERHDTILVMSLVSPESRFRNVVGSHEDLVKALLQIKLGVP